MNENTEPTQEVVELDTDIVKKTIVDLENGNCDLDIRTPYIVRTVNVPTQMRIPLYVAGVLKSEEELAELGLTIREYTRLEVETAYYADLYARDAAGDGALQLRVRQYKAQLDQLGLPYDAEQDTVMAAIQSAPLSDAEKAALALTMKTVYDAITTNLEFYGSDTPHMDTYKQLAKLIRFLPTDTDAENAETEPGTDVPASSEEDAPADSSETTAQSPVDETEEGE